jgi:hypothetical protein
MKHNTVSVVAYNKEFSSAEVTQQLTACLPTRAEETDKCTRMVEAGARDGVSGKREMYVDGMPLERSLQIIDALRSTAV